MKKIVCAVCLTNKNTSILYSSTAGNKKLSGNTFSARRVPDRIHYRLNKCNKCGLIFSNPILSLNEIGEFYKKSDFNYAKESEFLRKVYYSYFLKKMPDVNKESRILEIGCGNGFFLEELHKNGFKNIFGVEPGVESVNKSSKKIKKRILLSFFNKKNFKGKKFDIVFCFHTLDHIVDPNRFLKDVFSVLNKNGSIFFVFHDANGLSVKLFGEKSPIFDIEHIFLFNKNNANILFKKNGFHDINTFNVSNKYPLSYWVHLLPITLSIKKILLSFLKVSRLESFPLTFNAGNMGIVASKVK